ncbi:MAG: hydantoinase B/oxoprolinase family protein [Candidatus Binatia bacterium]
MSLPAGNVDPITFEILSHRLYQIAREMGTTLERVGGTVNTTQQKDYMAALYRADGEILSAGESIGMHMACGGFAVKKILERFGDEGVAPDDAFLLNDPYVAAVHQSDLFMISPIHYQRRLVAWSATFVHVMDIGALSPGGNSPGATEIFHEGIRIPGIKLIDGGALRKDLFDTIINMTRQPTMVGLDLKCQIAANNVAKSRVQEMFAQYGPELIDAVTLRMIQHAEDVLRKRITEIPDGVWKETSAIEADESWKVNLSLTKIGDRLIFDFTGSDPQASKGINLPYHATFGVCFSAVLSTLAYDLPKNHGIFRPIEVVAPKGTIVNPQSPAPVSMNTTSGAKIVLYAASSTLMQALATHERWKSETMAMTVGRRNIRHAGINQYGTYYVSNLSQTPVDGGGARSFQDGVDSGGGTKSCPNVEWIERNFPVLYLFRRHARDSAGAGKFRGGVGAETAFVINDAPEGKIKGVAYGVVGLKNSGQGVFGGYPGAPAVVELFKGTRLREAIAEGSALDRIADLGGQMNSLPYCNFELTEEDVLYTRQSSGGGYGDPLERDAQRVLKDVVLGLVSTEAADEVYGVVIDHDKIDVDATERLRTAMRRARLVNGR